MNNLEEMSLNLDSSLSTSLDKSLSREEYKERLITLVEPILQRRFSDNPVKQKIKFYRDRLTIACPYCGDSMQRNHKKRGNIILDGKFKNHYKCFNCGEFKRVDTFLKDFNVDLELDVINYISNNLKDFRTSIDGSYDISLLLDVETIESYAIGRQEILDKLSLVEVKDSSVWPWLKRRLQFQTDRFLYHPQKNYLLILNLTPSGKIIGFQKRSFGHDDSGSKYLTYNLSRLYEGFYPGKEVHPEVDLISAMFGIMQLNFNLPVTLFEGAFDSFLFRNSIALAGAHKVFPLDIPVRYWFDDDRTGMEKSIKYIEQKETVFLWERFKTDLDLPNRKKWDLNDVMIWLKENNKPTPLFENYFSNDPLDIIDI